MKDIKNIVFDLGGVLVDLDRDASVRQFVRMGYHEAATLLDPYRQSGIFQGLEEGTVKPDALYRHIQAHTTGISPRMVDQALYAFLTDLPRERLDLLLRLRGDYKVYLLSNTNPIMMDYIVRTWMSVDGRTPADYFDRMFLSYEMGLLKPSHEIFLRMAREAGMAPAETLFIDDSPANVASAAELGFKTYHARPGENLEAIFT